MNRLHRLLSELTPGQAKKDLTALQGKAILAGMRPRDLAGKTRRRLAVEQVAELMAVEKMKALTKELKAMVLARGSTLMELTGSDRWWRPGSWPTSATSPGSPTATGSPPGPGAAPIDASSGEQIRHRLSRAGNRKMNHVLHIAAACQARLDPPTGATTDARSLRARPAWKRCAA